MSVRDEPIALFRAKLLTVSGITQSLVKWDGEPDSATPSVLHYRESLSLGESIDKAIGPVRWRRVDGWYQIMVMSPVRSDITVATDKAAAIESAFLLGTYTTTTGSWPVIVTNTSIGDRKRESSWLKIPVTLYYTFTYLVS